MTFEERLAALGVDLSDLPKEYDDSHIYKYFVEAINFFTEKGKDPSTMSYPLYLVDIIDRMETRIVNLTLERDYLLTQVEEDCTICANADPKNHRVCAKYDILPDECFEFEGVPDDWSVDE